MANLRDLIAATGLVILLKLDWNRRFFARVTLKFGGWPRKIIRHVSYTTSSFNLCIISDPSGNSNWRYSPETANLGQNRRFFAPCDLWIWRMTLKNNRAPLLFHFKLCASFRSHWWIQTWVTVRKRPIWVKFDDFQSRVTSKFDAWPWKTIGHLFYATSSFVHHFVAISDFKLEIQSGNAKFGSKSTIFRAVWPWNLMCDLEKQ